MLKSVPWANTLASVSVLFGLVLWLLGALSPELFRLVYNAQFLGADMASQYPTDQDLGSVVVTLVALGVTGWIAGYVWASLYNRWAK